MIKVLVLASCCQLLQVRLFAAAGHTVSCSRSYCLLVSAAAGHPVSCCRSDCQLLQIILSADVRLLTCCFCSYNQDNEEPGDPPHIPSTSFSSCSLPLTTSHGGGGGVWEWMGRLLAWSTFTSMYLEAVIKNRSDNWIVYRSSTFRLKRNTSHNKQYYFLTVTL